MNIKPAELRLNNLVRLKDKGVYQLDTFHDLEEVTDFLDDTDYCVGVVLNKTNVSKYFNDVEVWGTKIDGMIDEEYNLLVFKNVVDGTSDIRLHFYVDGRVELWIDEDELLHIPQLTMVHHFQNAFYVIAGFDADVKL